LSKSGSSVIRRRAIEGAWLGALLIGISAVTFALPPLPTTSNDFFEPGTQPNTLSAALVSPSTCRFCHGDYSDEEAPFNRWAASMMAQSARDPIFKAALAVANQDAANVGETCIRCHAPGGFVNGHATPADGSALTAEDQQGVSCSICHRMVDPQFSPGLSPADDLAILQGLSPAPLLDPHNGSFVLDPQDRRRGPYYLQSDWTAAGLGGWPPYHEYRQSPFHMSSRLCASCHDVSLPHYTKQSDGTYALNALDTPGPGKHLEFPEQRTYSEWTKSLFAQGPVDLAGRFGGTRGGVSSCQDCHMPGTSGEGCALEPPMRPKLPQHNFSGANSWVLRAIRDIYFDSETGLSEFSVNEAIARNAQMMRSASDLEVTRTGSTLNARIINFSGHKLPTGYPEGRMMWINVKFLDASGGLVAERGRYDTATATLDGASTKVYEMKSGIDATVAALTGRPQGPGFHLALNNTILKDNRIPPMGYNRAEFESVGAGHVPANLYANGQYWDDTPYVIPAGAARAEVRVFHQTTTKEYIEFLRDENRTNTAGDIAYELWDFHAQSPPVEMDFMILPLSCRCDWDNNGTLTLQDLFDFLTSWFASNGDFNGDGATLLQDIFDYLTCFFNGCQ